MLAITSERDVVLCDCLEVIGIKGRSGEVGVEITGADAVHGNAILAPFGRKGAGEVDYAAFCCMIGSTSYNEISYKTVHRSDVDDAAEPSLDHLLTKFTGADECAIEVNVHLMFELVICDLFGRAYGSGAGIVHKDIYAAEFFDCSGNSSLHPFSVSNIASERENFYSEFFGDGFGVFFEEVLPAGKKYKICTLAGESLSHLEAKPGGGTRNNRYAAGKIKIIFHKRFTLSMFFRLEI